MVLPQSITVDQVCQGGFFGAGGMEGDTLNTIEKIRLTKYKINLRQLRKYTLKNISANTPTIHVSVQLHPFHEVEIKQHRVIMTEYVFHTLEANFAEFAAEYGLIFGSWSLLPNMD